MLPSAATVYNTPRQTDPRLPTALRFSSGKTEKRNSKVSVGVDAYGDHTRHTILTKEDEGKGHTHPIYVARISLNSILVVLAVAVRHRSNPL